LAAQRTAALQETLAARPDVAFDALLHVLVRHAFFDAYGPSCLWIEPRVVELNSLSPSLPESKAARALEKRRSKWRQKLPDESRLWLWIKSLNAREKRELMACCVAATLDATDRHASGGTQDPGWPMLAASLRLDMSDWWRPTKDSFFNRLTKNQILE